jgi:O-antigen/teichoic acid export membrane protein
MAVIGAIYAIVALFVDLGLSNALIHFPDPPPHVLSTLYWLNLGAAALMMLTFMLVAWPVASLYRQPELLPLMLALSLTMPLAALGHQFCVMAEKALHFSVLALIEVAAAVCGFAAAVVVALLGGGAYALVATSLVAATLSSVLAWLFLSQGIRPTFHFDLGVVKPYLRYGSYRLGDAILNNVQSQADILIGGAAVGSAAMGVYAVPRNLSLLVAYALINPVVTRVGLPVMARLQHDQAALRSVYLQTLRMTASMNFPIYAALAAWSHDVVAIFLGDQWSQAGDFLRLFAVWGLMRSISNPVGSLLYAIGRVRTAFWWNLALLLLVPGLLWLGTRLAGLQGLAVSMICVQVLIFYPLFRLLVHPACGIRFREYMGALLPALVASAFAVAVGFLVSWVFSQNAWTRVATGCAAVAMAYIGASCVVNRAWVAAMGELLRPMLRRTT